MMMESIQKDLPSSGIFISSKLLPAANAAEDVGVPDFEFALLLIKDDPGGSIVIAAFVA